MSASQKLRWRKLVNQLRYMYKELDILDEISAAVAADFQKYYEEFCRKNDIDIIELNHKHAERIQKIYETSDKDDTCTDEFEEEDNKQMSDIFSKLFKKLALQLHPDKLNFTDLTDEQKDDMLNMFTKARAALEERRYFVLIDYAEKLNIPLPKNYKQQTRWMKKELEMVREKRNVQMKSYNYMFAEAESDEVKDSLMYRFIQQLFNVTLPVP